jgi:hypothetical protein
MEQDPEVRDPGQEEVWAAVKDRAGAAEARGAVLEQARGAIASAPSAVRKWPINWESPATIRNAPSAAPP